MMTWNAVRRMTMVLVLWLVVSPPPAALLRMRCARQEFYASAE